MCVRAAGCGRALINWWISSLAWAATKKKKKTSSIGQKNRDEEPGLAPHLIRALVVVVRIKRGRRRRGKKKHPEILLHPLFSFASTWSTQRPSEAAFSTNVVVCVCVRVTCCCWLLLFRIKKGWEREWDREENDWSSVAAAEQKMKRKDARNASATHEKKREKSGRRNGRKKKRSSSSRRRSWWRSMATDRESEWRSKSSLSADQGVPSR